MLVGVIHLPPLPGSPRASQPADAIAASAAEDARVLAAAGFDAIVVENFGDAPFFRAHVPPVTVSAMTLAAAAVRAAAPRPALCINVLRNDAESALAIAHVAGAQAVRINIHVGARVTDQGVIEGRAAETLRSRRALGAEGVAIWADVDVKHSSPLGHPSPSALEQEVSDAVHRGLATAVLVTGDGTGKGVDTQKLARVKASADGAMVLVASGATVASLGELAASADGVIVGSALRRGGVAGGVIDAELATAFAAAFRKAFPGAR
jgi:membrane complex biogenesis BtpA family protein